MEMENLVEFTQEKMKDDSEHPLLIISDFVVRFLSIHPFQDGNGRLSRILTNLLMLRAGYDYVQYSSHERIVEATKEQYYLSLREAQKSLKEQEPSLLIWTEFFLEMLKRQKDVLFEKIKREKLGHIMPKLSQDLLTLAKEHGQVTVSFLSNALPANRNTVKKHLQQLTRAGKLVLHGKARGAFYTLP